MLRTSAGVLHDVHARAPSVDDVEQTTLINADIVGLDWFGTVGDSGNEAAYLLRAKRIADIDRPQSGIEVSNEDLVGPWSFVGDVFQDIMGAEPSSTIEVFLAFREPG